MIALTGTSNEPNIKKSNTNVATTMIAAGRRHEREDRRLRVDERRRRAADECFVERCVDRADRATISSASTEIGSTRGTTLNHVASPEVDAVGANWPSAGSTSTMSPSTNRPTALSTRATPSIIDAVPAYSAIDRSSTPPSATIANASPSDGVEVVAEDVGLLADLGRLRKHPVVGHAPLDAQEWHAEGERGRSRRRSPPCRATHHPGRQTVPEARRRPRRLDRRNSVSESTRGAEHGQQCRAATPPR